MTLWPSSLSRVALLALTLVAPQHADQHRPQRPVLLAVDQ
jgi:hypothetical protein